MIGVTIDGRPTNHGVFSVVTVSPRCLSYIFTTSRKPQFDPDFISNFKDLQRKLKEVWVGLDVDVVGRPGK